MRKNIITMDSNRKRGFELMIKKENEKKRTSPRLAIAAGLALLISVPVVTMCRDNHGRWDDEFDDELNDDQNDTNVVGCDPDSLEPCVEEFFICILDEDDNKICEGREPALPDDGDWMCAIEDGELVCWGDHFPDNGDWDCEELPSGHIECRTTAPVPGDAGGDENYDCYHDGEFIICEEEGEEQWFPDDGNDSCPPGGELGSNEICGDEIDNDCDGYVDENCIDDCLCIPGAWRYCDTPTYCRWGQQYCNPDGMSWGSCDEVSPPTGCEDDYIYSVVCCVASGACCQDYWDEDDDGDIQESHGNCIDIVCE